MPRRSEREGKAGSGRGSVVVPPSVESPKGAPPRPEPRGVGPPVVMSLSELPGRTVPGSGESAVSRRIRASPAPLSSGWSTARIRAATCRLTGRGAARSAMAPMTAARARQYITVTQGAAGRPAYSPWTSAEHQAG